MLDNLFGIGWIAALPMGYFMPQSWRQYIARYTWQILGPWVVLAALSFVFDWINTPQQVVAITVGLWIGATLKEHGGFFSFIFGGKDKQHGQNRSTCKREDLQSPPATSPSATGDRDIKGEVGRPVAEAFAAALFAQAGPNTSLAPDQEVATGWRWWTIRRDGRLRSLVFTNNEWVPQQAQRSTDQSGRVIQPGVLMFIGLAITSIWALFTFTVGSIYPWDLIPLVLGIGLFGGGVMALAGDRPTPGLYAWNSPLALIDETFREPSQYKLADRTFIGGRVSLWGKVIYAEKGMTGEFAYPQSFDVFWCPCCLIIEKLSGALFSTDSPLICRHCSDCALPRNVRAPSYSSVADCLSKFDVPLGLKAKDALVEQ